MSKQQNQQTSQKLQNPNQKEVGAVQQKIEEQANLDDALDDIMNDKGLNISNDSAGDDFIDPKIEEEYKKFMKEMGVEGSGGGGLEDMMKNLLSSINPSSGTKQGEGNKEQQQQFKSTMNDLLTGLEGGNIEDVANKLLSKFMDKQILQEPLQETKKAYEQIFNNPSSVKATEDDLQRYRKQYIVVQDILNILKNDPNNKQKLIKKFEQMQLYGNPPEGIHVGM